jgi:hypothetical protein
MTVSFRFLAMIGVAALSACSPKVSETGRFANPSGTIDAVTAIRETNATVATPTEVYLVGKGARISGAPVFRADNLEGLRVTWTDEARLVIHANKARVFLKQDSKVVALDSRKIQVKIDLDITKEIP